MFELPDKINIVEPKDSKLLYLKNSTLFLLSSLAEILNIGLNLLNLNKFDNKIIVIIILAITIIILFVDIIILYVKDRENYYKNIYYINMYHILSNNMKTLSNDIDKIRSLKH